jgi:hypothetical protein
MKAPEISLTTKAQFIAQPGHFPAKKFANPSPGSSAGSLLPEVTVM